MSKTKGKMYIRCSLQFFQVAGIIVATISIIVRIIELLSRRKQG